MGFSQLSRRGGKRYPQFDLRMQARADDIIWENGRVAGVRAQTPEGPLEVRADLTIAADGRESIVRPRAGLEITELGAPMDVLWLRLTKWSEDPHETFGYIRDGRIMALIDRGAYWQCAYVIPKGTIAEIKREVWKSFGGKSARSCRFCAPVRASCRAGMTLSS